MPAPAWTRSLFLGLLAAAVVAPSLDGGFLHWDDRALVLDNPVAAMPPGRALEAAFAAPAGTTYWPLRDLSYALDHALWGFDPFGFHLTNLILYTAVVVGLHVLLVPLLGRGPAFLAGLFFAVHPLHAEPVAWISGRKDLLAAAFLLLAWTATFRRAGEGRAARLLRFTVALAAYVAACLSKTSALPFPLAWWLQDRLIPPGADRRWHVLERLPFLLAMGLMAAGQAAFSLGAGSAGRYLLDAAGLRQMLATPLGALVDQGAALLLPLGLDPAYPQPGTVWTAGRWAGWVLVLAGAGVLALRLREGRATPGLRRALFGIGWAVLFLLPVLNILLPTSTPRADRYAFLPSMGFCIAAAVALERLRPWTRLLPAVAWAALAFQASARWTGDDALWRDALRRQPASFLAAGGLGWGYVEAGLPRRAQWALERMARIDPASPVAHHQLGGFFKARGDVPRALLEYGEALRLYAGQDKGRPGVRVPGGYRLERRQALLELAEILMDAGHPEAAASRAQEAADLDPRDPRSWAALGLYRTAQGDLEAAGAAADRAVALAPAWPEGLGVRARVAQRRGEAAWARKDPEAAMAAFAQAAADCRAVIAAGAGGVAARSRLGYVEACRSQLAADPEVAAALRALAIESYEAIPEAQRTEGDRQNLKVLLGLQARGS